MLSAFRYKPAQENPGNRPPPMSLLCYQCRSGAIVSAGFEWSGFRIMSALLVSAPRREHEPENEKERIMITRLNRAVIGTIAGVCTLLSITQVQAQTNLYRQDRILVKPSVAS